MCGYIGSENSRNLLIEEGINIYSNLNADHLEIRDFIDLKDFCSQNSFSTHILDLCPDIDKVWYKLEKKVLDGQQQNQKV